MDAGVSAGVDAWQPLVFEGSQELNTRRLNVLSPTRGLLTRRTLMVLCRRLEGNVCLDTHAVGAGGWWMGCILGNLSNEQTQCGEQAFRLTHQISDIRGKCLVAMSFKMLAFYRRLSRRRPLPFSALLSSCFSHFFVSFSSVTEAVADTLRAVFPALIMHRCCG